MMDRDWVVVVAGQFYIDRGGMVCRDRDRAYRFSRKGAQLYISGNRSRWPDLSVTMELLPKRDPLATRKRH